MFSFNIRPPALPTIVISPDTTLLPTRIKIPKLDIDTAVEHVGVAVDGTMGVPFLPENTAWYNLGPRPGEVGSAVIDGHAGWRDGKPAVFDYLYKLRIGDKIFIEDKNGFITTFVVYKKETHKEDGDSSSAFNSNDQGIYLNLITCSGIWDEANKKHPDRLVVFTKEEI